MCFASTLRARHERAAKAVFCIIRVGTRSAGQPLTVHKEEHLYGVAACAPPRRRNASAAMPRRRHAALLLLPLRAATETPYAKTPYEQWEEDTYYPHRRRPLPGLPQSSFGPEAEHVLGLRRACQKP